jgi:hypothetical protein
MNVIGVSACSQNPLVWFHQKPSGRSRLTA